MRTFYGIYMDSLTVQNRTSLFNSYLSISFDVCSSAAVTMKIHLLDVSPS